MMRTDIELKQDGMRILSDNLGLVETERFISLVIREPFDYTEWQRKLYTDVSIEDLCEKADRFWIETHIK
jgi:hypothetical protein